MKTRLATFSLLLSLAAMGLFHTTPALSEEAASFTAPVLENVPDTTGHVSVRYQENTVQKDADFLPFSTLAKWPFSVENPKIPESVAKLSGKTFDMVGFMYPLQEGDSIKAFLLMATTQTCCYGPRPEFTQFVLVEMPEPVPFARLRPVKARGKLVVEVRPEDGYILRMEGLSAIVAPEERIMSGGANLSSLPAFEWHWLISLPDAARETSLEELKPVGSFSELLGKRVQVKGNLSWAPNPIDTFGLRIAKYYWDGCCTGVPPGIFNSIGCTPASGTMIPSQWHKSGTAVGVLKLVPPEERVGKGIFLLEDTTFPVLSDQFEDPSRIIGSSVPAILKAASQGDLAGLRLLLRAGANPNDRDMSGNSALHEAAAGGFIDLIPPLIKAGLSVDVRNKDHRTPIFEAMTGSSLEAVVLLASSGADLGIQDRLGFTPLLWGIARSTSEQIPLLLIDRGCDLRKQNGKGYEAVQLAVLNDKPNVIARLFEKGVPKDLKDPKGRTLRELTQETKNASMAEFLGRLGVEK